MSANTVVSIRTDIVAGIEAAQSGPDLHQFLQCAVELEHATIPAYLAAYYSIKPGANAAAGAIIRSIVVQEMLHMTIAANVLNALGGSPVINKPDFIPTYPGPLPMSVDDGLIVPLEKLSLELVEKVFMRIELPETPQHFPSFSLTAAERGYATIGQFYDAIIRRIRILGDKIFTGDTARQVVDATWFPPDQLFAITDAASAVRGLEIIKRQGEGTTTDPLEVDGEAAHYYRFEEIARGHRLVKDPSVPQGYSFTGAPVPFDPAGVIDIVANSNLADYTPGTLAYSGVAQANYSYTSLLNALHETFNGSPGTLRSAIALMYELRLVVLEKVVNQQLADGPNKGQYAAPAFQFTPAAAR